jgi:hypothetical protein
MIWAMECRFLWRSEKLKRKDILLGNLSPARKRARGDDGNFFAIAFALLIGNSFLIDHFTGLIYS